MPKRSTITVFEHDVLRVGDELTPGQFGRFARFFDTVSGDYFSLGYNAVKFGHYVGILQMGDLTIEVLPKADRGSPNDAPRWRDTLLDMLILCRVIDPKIVDKALQSTKEHVLLDILFLQFLQRTKELLQQGLVRRYYNVESDVTALKGRLLFAKDLERNLLHPERWFTDHSVYDRAHRLHGILRCALGIVSAAAPDWLRRSTGQIAAELADIQSFRPDASFMEHLRYDRKTERYRSAIDLSWLIIRNYTPSLAKGRESVFALMFNMDKLFEETVYRLLWKEAHARWTGLEILQKQNRPFWGSMRLVPDICIRNGDENTIIDTKWKLPKGENPEESDLRQVFAYSLYFGASRAILLFPDAQGRESKHRCFSRMEAAPALGLSCALVYANIFNEQGHLNGAFARDFLDGLTKSKAGK